MISASPCRRAVIALALPAAASATLPARSAPLGAPEVKWVIGPTGHVGSGAGMGYEYVEYDDVTYPACTRAPAATRTASA